MTIPRMNLNKRKRNCYKTNRKSTMQLIKSTFGTLDAATGGEGNVEATFLSYKRLVADGKWRQKAKFQLLKYMTNGTSSYVDGGQKKVSTAKQRIVHLSTVIYIQFCIWRKIDNAVSWSAQSAVSPLWPDDSSSVPLQYSLEWSLDDSSSDR